MGTKIDPYKHKEKYLAWQEKTGNKIPEISARNSQIILDYLYDMEHGLNIAKGSKKGARSYNRLNNIRQRLVFLAKKFHELYGLDDITQISERQIHKFFTDMKNGTIRRLDGKIYRDPVNFVKLMKAFWHWWQKINKKKGIEIYDLTSDLNTQKDKPRWVYLTEDEIKKIYDEANYKYKVLIMFLLDTGIRAPSELININVSDFYNDFKELMIRDEISKTFGRRIKLMLCTDLIKGYIKKKGFKENDHVFLGNYQSMNKVFKRLGKKIFGDVKSPAGEKYSNLTLYDFRHCSCCYWLPRYKSESALKYRFGWKKSDKIHYYSELLGMRDTIAEEDLLVDVTKTEIEQRLTKAEREAEFLKDDNQNLRRQMKQIMELVIQMRAQMEVLVS